MYVMSSEREGRWELLGLYDPCLLVLQLTDVIIHWERRIPIDRERITDRMG